MPKPHGNGEKKQAASRSSHVRPADPDVSDSSQLERQRRIKADMLEIELAKKTGSVVPIEDRDALLATRAAEFRRGLEAALLHRLPPRLATMTDPAEIAEELEGVIRELLERYTRPVD